MQELLGRIAALDTDATLGIRVISCFDELIAGNVNTPGLLRTAAALAGCPAGFQSATANQSLRFDPTGRQLLSDPPAHTLSLQLPDGSTVWLESRGSPQPNDQLILERLALAVGIRRGGQRSELEKPRDAGTVLDPDAAPERRADAAARLGLAPGQRRAVLAVPLFAVWSERQQWPGDVIATRFGPVHALLVPEQDKSAGIGTIVKPAGLGPLAHIDDFPHSFEIAVIALRLSTPQEPFVSEESYGGLLPLLGGEESYTGRDDAHLLELIKQHQWASSALHALAQSSSVRQAAKTAHVHHSTMQSYVETIHHVMGFSPVEGYGRMRIGLAYLKWRVRTSTVFSAPPPG